MHVIFRFSLAIFLLFTMLFIGCNGEEVIHKDQLEATYKKSKRYRDFEVATQTIYRILELDPTAHEWEDSLAQIYFSRKSYYQVAVLADEILQRDEKNTHILTLSANASKFMGDQSRSKEQFNKLFELTNDVQYLYDVASAQYNLQSKKEAEMTVAKILKHPDIDKAKVKLFFNKQSQEVPLKAAAINLLGVIAKDEDKKDLAKEYFEKALALFPEFILGKGNLEELNNGQK